MIASAACLSVDLDGEIWPVGTEYHDLSIPMAFDRAQPSFFGVQPASERTVAAGKFVGDVREGGSCNCATYTLTPHCNGTHTECIGHLTAERLSVSDVRIDALTPALLITVEPVPATQTSESARPAPQPGDYVLTRAAIESAVRAATFGAFRSLLIRTLPNDMSKRTRNYQIQPAPYFTTEAMRWIVHRGVQHLIVDLPSVDRGEDEGQLNAHRIFWNIPAGTHATGAKARREATITELAFIDNSVGDGAYLLNLQVAPFVADAAPSRPIVWPLRRS